MFIVCNWPTRIIHFLILEERGNSRRASHSPNKKDILCVLFDRSLFFVSYRTSFHFSPHNYFVQTTDDRYRYCTNTHHHHHQIKINRNSRSSRSPACSRSLSNDDVLFQLAVLFRLVSYRVVLLLSCRVVLLVFFLCFCFAVVIVCVCCVDVCHVISSSSWIIDKSKCRNGNLPKKKRCKRSTIRDSSFSFVRA